MVANRRVVAEPIQIDPEDVWADTASHLDRPWQEEHSEIFRIPSPAKIILNTNKNVDRPVRLFSDSKRTPDAIDDWDPMKLSSIFSDDATSKDVLKTLDILRDRLK